MLTACIALLGWLIQSFIYSAVEKSRETFMAVLDKRIGISAKVKTHLVMIGLFMDDPQEGMNFKEKLQNLLLSSEACGFLDKRMFADLIDLSVQEQTDGRKVERLIRELNADISKWSRKVETEVNFFVQFHHPIPVRRMLLTAWLILQCATLLTLLLLVIYSLYVQFLQLTVPQAIAFSSVLAVLLWTAPRLFKFFRWKLLNQRASPKR